MSNGDLNFGDIEVKKSAFHISKYPIETDEVDIKRAGVYPSTFVYNHFFPMIQFLYCWLIA